MDDQLLNAVHDKQLIQLRKELREAQQQNALFMYRLCHIIEVASETREANSDMQQIMDLASGSRDAEMIESGIV